MTGLRWDPKETAPIHKMVETAPGRQPCPVCDGLPIDTLAKDQDGRSIVHPLARRCCNPACDESWGTGCYHCHWVGYFDERVSTLDIVEGWARARGWRWDNWDASFFDAAFMTPGQGLRHPRPWLEPLPDVDSPWIVNINIGSGLASISDRVQVWVATPSVALLWSTLLDGEPIMVDVGRCLACEARGCGPGRKLATHVWTMAHHGRWGRRITPCPTCDANLAYRDIREAGRLCLDWMAVKPAMLGDLRPRALHAAIRVAADLAQHAGDIRGEWISLALARDEEWLPPARIALARSTYRSLHPQPVDSSDVDLC